MRVLLNDGLLKQSESTWMSGPVFVPRWPRTRESSTFVTNEAYREQGDNQGTGDGVFSANVVLTKIRTLNILQRMVDHGGRGEMPREYMTHDGDQTEPDERHTAKPTHETNHLQCGNANSMGKERRVNRSCILFTLLTCSGPDFSARALLRS